VELLLRLGADPNATDSGKHAPLYCLSNESKEGGGDAVRALIRGGALVNACDGVKRCTALHMAARRGNVEIAEALLDCGADTNAHDSQGVTPLQRAINCRQVAVAELLRSAGPRPGRANAIITS
jgi:ankyrin repeat protein